MSLPAPVLRFLPEGQRPRITERAVSGWEEAGGAPDTATATVPDSAFPQSPEPQSALKGPKYRFPSFGYFRICCNLRTILTRRLNEEFLI